MSESRTAATPGPWRTVGSKGRLIQGADGTMVADADHAVGAEADANAHLIAAAPALYAVAVSALQRMEADPEADQFLVRNFKAAIAQAEGRQQ